MGRPLLVILSLIFSALRINAADVVTQHNDIGRTGANLEEKELTPASVNYTNFGRLFSRPVDGQVYAQPLIVSDIRIPDHGVHNAVYVATMKNNLYAFDADHAEEQSPLWQTNLGEPVPYKHIPFSGTTVLENYSIKEFIGITSTPVIDKSSRRMWAVAKIMENTNDPGYHLFCLDITTGKILARSADIQISDDGDASEEDRLQAWTALQRPGLLLANGMVYVAFGSHEDAGIYHGWLTAFDAKTLELKYSFNTTKGDKHGRGAIWQSGSGPAADAQGNVYVMTGNGAFKPGEQYSDSIIKLDPQLNVQDWFTPWNEKKLTILDLDLGSTGPMLIPGTADLVGAGKQGWLYLLNRDRMGHQQHWHRTAPALQAVKVTDHWSINWLSWMIPTLGYHHIHGTPAYWNSNKLGPLIYIWPEETRLRAYRYLPKNRLIRTRPIANGPKLPPGMPGGFLSISANGGKNGLLWASSPLTGDAHAGNVEGVLRVFDATNLRELWSSTEDSPEDVFFFAKFCPPTIANGKVYLPTFSDKLNVYGIIPPSARARNR